jgi:hypothetical protein
MKSGIESFVLIPELSHLLINLKYKHPTSIYFKLRVFSAYRFYFNNIFIGKDQYSAHEWISII